MNIEMRPIPGFEGLYSVTADGRVYSHSRIDARGNRRLPKYLKLIPDGDGYLRAHLCVGGMKRKWPVHRLVAMAFIENNQNRPLINHVDGVKTNNSVENLEWCTSEENSIHAQRLGLLNNNRNELGQYQGVY